MASVPGFFRLIVILFMAWFQIGEAKNHSFYGQPRIKRGYTLSANSNLTWSSPSNYFHFGFYQEGNGFAIGIWLESTNKTAVSSPQKTVVWTANRDDPFVDSNSKLEFTSSGELVLRFSKHKTLHQKKHLMAGIRAASASLLDSGNLVLCGNDSGVLWQSFDHPTDTLLAGQVLPAGDELVASASDNDHSSGGFHLIMQLDGALVLYPMDSENGYFDNYWSDNYWSPNFFEVFIRIFLSKRSIGFFLLATDYSFSSRLQVFYLFLNSSTGVLSLVNSTDSEDFHELNSKAIVNETNDMIFRATVDCNGNFQVFAYKMGRVKYLWYCTLYDGKPNCFCVPGTEDADDDAGNRLLGCVRNYTHKACRSNGKENETLYEMVKMENTMLDDFT